MVAFDGTLLAENIAVSEVNFIQGNVFDRDPDKEDYEGYMGNSGPDATHFYHHTVQSHPSSLSEYSLNLNAGHRPSAFHISQALASRGGQPTECGHQYLDATFVQNSDGGYVILPSQRPFPSFKACNPLPIGRKAVALAQHLPSWQLPSSRRQMAHQSSSNAWWKGILCTMSPYSFFNLKRGLCRNRQRLVAFQTRHGGVLAKVSSMSHSRSAVGVQRLLI